MNQNLPWLSLVVLLIAVFLSSSGCNGLREIIKTPPTQTSSGQSQDKPTLVPPELVPSSNAPPTDLPPKATEIQSALTTDPILRGMNIGNALEAPEPGVWGVTIREAYVSSIANEGFNAVRIPIRFSAHTAGPPDYLIDPDFFDTVDEVFYWGLDADLLVILDFHGFDEIMQNPSENEEKFLKIWEQLAEHYQTFPATLWFEPLNEPSGNLDAATWNEFLRSAVRIIRQTNPTRKILIGGVDYSTIDSLYLLNLPEDANLIGVFHYYQPFEFTHQGASWVEGSANWLGTDWTGTDSQKEEVRSALDHAMAWSHQAQVPILMGEFGVINKADSESRRQWISFVTRAAEEREIGWLHWGFCSDLGVYDCDKNEWDKSLLDELIHP